MNITLTTLSPEAGDLIIPVLQSDSLADQLAHLAPTLGVSAEVLQRDFKADAKEVLAVYGQNGQKIYLLGLGKDPQEMDWLRTFRKFFFDQKSKLPATLAIDLTTLEGSVVAGVVLGVRGAGMT